MLPWIQTALKELQREADEAERRFSTADEAHTKATDDLDDARNNWIAVRDLLKNFREYADAQPKGGA